MHLQRLETAGLVAGTLELSEDGNAMKFFAVTPFAIQLTPGLIAEAAQTLIPGPGPDTARNTAEITAISTRVTAMEKLLRQIS